MSDLPGVTTKTAIISFDPETKSLEIGVGLSEQDVLCALDRHLAVWMQEHPRHSAVELGSEAAQFLGDRGFAIQLGANVLRVCMCAKCTAITSKGAIN